MNNLLIYHGLIGGGDGKSTSSGSGTRTPKDLAKKLAKMQSLVDRTGEEFVSENVYYDSFDGLNKRSLGQIDLTSFTITTNSSHIINTKDKVSLSKLKIGQEVTLLKGSMIERVIIDSIGDGFFTINTPIESDKFNGGTVARSMATIHGGKLLLTPADATEYDIRYRIVPKEKQPKKIHTWIKYDNPSECEVYDSVVKKVGEDLKYYKGVEITSAELKKDKFKLALTFNVPKDTLKITLYIGLGKSPTKDNYDSTYVIDSRGELATKEVDISSLDKDVHYRFICEYEGGVVNDSLYQGGVIEIKGVYKYVIRIHKNQPDPSLAVEYIGASSEVNDWESVEPFNKIRPVLLSTKGEVVGEIDKNDFNKMIDGTNIPSTTEKDIMIEFPRVYWTSVNTDLYTDIIVSNEKVEPNMKSYAHRTGGVDKEKLYVGAYRGYTTNNGLWSNGGSADSNLVANGFRAYVKRKGVGHGLMTWHTMSLIKVLFLLRYKTLDSQSVCGQGYTSNYSSVGSGLYKVGMTSTPQASGTQWVKLFGLCDIWGSGEVILDGIFTKKGIVRIVEDNLRCDEYLEIGEDTPLSFEGESMSGRVEEIQGEGAHLFYPKKINPATYDKFYGDQAMLSTSTGSSYYVVTTCYFSSSKNMGLFGSDTVGLVSSSSYVYSRPIYL